MNIKYIGETNNYLTEGKNYYSHYYGIDDVGQFFICIRDDDNKNHILTKNYIEL